MRAIDRYPVRADEQHAFLAEPRLEDDPILVAWERHFQRTGVRYVKAHVGRGAGRRMQLFVHRAQNVANERDYPKGAKHDRWCCGRVPI